uniref:Venom allergen 5 n=1 Tax=Ascaris suum TaxID=6253 RepID=F1L9M7_ASCSU
MRYLSFVLCALIWVVNGEDCVDKVDFCHNIVHFKTCGLYQSQVNCRKSCKLCDKPMPPAPPTEDPSCNDTYRYCQQSFYLCGQYPYWEQKCRKTCELCGQTTVPSAKGTNSAQTTNSRREERPTATPEQERPTTRPSGTKGPGTATAVSCNNVRNQRFTPESRNVVLNRHNELRSMVANGTVKDASGQYLKSGKNIYELRWDCDMEERAQNWADTCRYGHSTYEYRKNGGENIYKWSKSDTYDSIDTNMLRATGMWWDEIKLINMTNAEDYIMNNKILGVAGHWSQQAWGATTKLGCGIANCSDGAWYATHVVCHYYVAGNRFKDQIYEFGNGCSNDSECTTYKNSTCNTRNKLCLQPRK